jgi:hypothetical protein
MPTTRPRIQVAETPAIERALEIAAQQWPKASRGELLRHLVEAGAQSIQSDRTGERLRRAAVVEANAGVLSDAYPEHYLEELRADWPA